MSSVYMAKFNILKSSSETRKETLLRRKTLNAYIDLWAGKDGDYNPNVHTQHFLRSQMGTIHDMMYIEGLYYDKRKEGLIRNADDLITYLLNL